MLHSEWFITNLAVKLFRGACGSKSLYTQLQTVMPEEVKLFRGACGSKSDVDAIMFDEFLSSSFAELVDLNSDCDVWRYGVVCQALSRSLWI